VTYTIKLPQFEGPFDLLLFFIERDELDIYDIPVAKITNDFLDYIRHLERLNIDIASEFILVAASLMRIKAKLLLPRKELDEEGNEIDPRQELVERLLEYKRYKSILSELQALEEERSRKRQRGNVLVEMQLIANQAMADAELENLNLFRLLQTYTNVLQGFREREERIVHTVVHYNYTIEGQRNFLVDFVRKRNKASFIDVFENCENRMHAIFTFLALLELLQQEQLEIVINGNKHNDFLLLAVEENSNEEVEDTDTPSDS
jgi:segregation and condensation protein A